ncbi:RNA polymerase sigma factor [Paraburkholderia oxyphila]|uniref:RNA polymerase sigma factor n=1 Tax=Paraburkholderia oxyphila TaxID=614212 RepID=UPI0005BC4C73|nr:RNA polymerase sigma factor [Paraburkholderia oxyphila]
MEITRQRARAGSPCADPLDRAWRAWQGKLRSRARYLCKGDLHGAEDLLSEAVLKVHLYMRNSPERVKNLPALLYVALDHAFLDHARRRARECHILQRDVEIDEGFNAPDPAPSAEAQLAIKRQLARIEQALIALAPGQQALFTLKFEEEHSYATIAALLGINEALARKRVELLRKELRKALD